MEYQSIDEILAYLEANIGADINSDGNKSYRAAARLMDGTFLSCVKFSNPNPKIDYFFDHLKDRLKGKTIDDNLPLSDVIVPIQISMFGNQVYDGLIARIEPCPFAFPSEAFQQIRGETSMGWTGFAARMRDGKYFAFGSTGGFEFFNMPEGYSPSDVVEIVNHAYVLKTGELRHFQRGFMDNPPDYDPTVVHLALPYFECFMEGI